MKNICSAVYEAIIVAVVIVGAIGLATDLGKAIHQAYVEYK